MTESNDKNAPLQWSVFITKRPGLNRELPPGYESLAWVPNSSTLIYGERDAVLVDTFLTAEASQALADWVAASGKNHDLRDPWPWRSFLWHRAAQAALPPCTGGGKT